MGPEVMKLADRELVVLRQTNGKVFAVSPVDEFDVEVVLLKNNPEFMALMEELSQETFMGDCPPTNHENSLSF